jgi:hypothetical protein
MSEKEALQLVAEIAADGRKVFNRPIYRINSLQFKSKRAAAIDLGLSTFFDFLFASGTLEDELFQALIANNLSPSKVIEDADKKLPLRKEVLPNPKALIDFPNRLCVSGFYVLLAFARPKPYRDYVFYAKRRSAEVHSGRGVVTLIPMGYYQPASTATAEEELPIENAIFNEIGEELFGVQELIEPPGRAVPGWCRKHVPGVKWLDDNSGSYSFELLSASINLLQGNCEFSVLLAIHEPAYLRQFGTEMPFNWEIDDQKTPRFLTSEPNRIAAALGDPFWTGAARLSLLEGLLRLKEIEPRRVKLPVLERAAFPAGQS